MNSRRGGRTRAKSAPSFLPSNGTTPSARPPLPRPAIPVVRMDRRRREETLVRRSRCRRAPPSEANRATTVRRNRRRAASRQIGLRHRDAGRARRPFRSRRLPGNPDRGQPTSPLSPDHFDFSQMTTRSPSAYRRAQPSCRQPGTPIHQEVLALPIGGRRMKTCSLASSRQAQPNRYPGTNTTSKRPMRVIHTRTAITRKKASEDPTNRYNQNQLVIQLSKEDNHKRVRCSACHPFPLAALTALELPPLQLIEVASASGFERVEDPVSPTPGGTSYPLMDDRNALRNEGAAGRDRRQRRRPRGRGLQAGNCRRISGSVPRSWPGASCQAHAGCRLRSDLERFSDRFAEYCEMTGRWV